MVVVVVIDFVVVVVNTRKLPIKFDQNWVNNS